MTIFYVEPANIRTVWKAIQPGLEVALEKSGAPGIQEIVRRRLAEGDFLLFIATDDKGYVGFAICQILHTEHEGNWFNVVYAWCDPKYDMHPELDAHLAELGRKYGLRGIRFYTQRKGYGKRVEPLGYRQRFVEYVKEL